jgi:hypothetical protein
MTKTLRDKLSHKRILYPLIRYSRLVPWRITSKLDGGLLLLVVDSTDKRENLCTRQTITDYGRA